MLVQRPLPAVKEAQGRATWSTAAAALALFGALAVLALRFPDQLTTPALRHLYDATWCRGALFAIVAAGGGLALATLLLRRGGRLSALSLGLSSASAILLAQADSASAATSSNLGVGLDWFLIDLFGSGLVFITLERAFALRREQPVLRQQWATDLAYFAVNHLAVGLVLLLANALASHVIGPALGASPRAAAAALPLWCAVPLCLLLADLVQYALHRVYHASPLLWRIHAVHHSVETMDWLAGSRQHLLELVVTRTLGLAPLIALGFDKTALDIAIGIAMLQAVLNHANIEWPRQTSPLAFLRFVVVTPQFHHWHHAREGADNTNFAALFSFIDHLFGTAIDRADQWPARYGLAPEESHRKCLDKRPAAAVLSSRNLLRR